MPKHQKTVLTKEAVQKELLLQLRSGRSLAIAGIFALVFILIPGAVAFFPLAMRDISGTYLIKLTLALIADIILSVMLCVICYRYFSKLYKAKKGRFSIVKDRMVSKKEKYEIRYKHMVLYKKFYFYFYGQYVIPKADEDIFGQYDRGDQFYLVVYNFKKSNSRPTPVLIYSTQTYEWEE